MNLLLGTIVLFPWNWAPRGYAACTGQLLPIQQNPALFSLLGIQFGGDGKTTFALPDLTSQAPKGLQYYIVINGLFPQP